MLCSAYAHAKVSQSRIPHPQVDETRFVALSQVGGAIQQFLLPEDGQTPKGGKIELDLPLLIGGCGCRSLYGVQHMWNNSKSLLNNQTQPPRPGGLQVEL
jgi:hypothetical protein